VGPETDRAQQNGPNGLTSPPGYTLASVFDLFNTSNPELEVGTMGSFQSAGAGTTFNAATINWALGLNHDQHSWNVIDQITSNVVSKLGPARPGPWTSVSEGKSLPGAPIAAVLDNQNRFTVVLADPGGGIYATSGNVTDGWQPWKPVPGAQSKPGAPLTAGITGPGQITLFMTDINGVVLRT